MVVMLGRSQRKCRTAAAERQRMLKRAATRDYRVSGLVQDDLC